MGTAGSGLAGARRQLGSARAVLRLDHHGQLAASRKTASMAGNTRNLLRIMKVNARRLDRLIDDSFRAQTDPQGKAWEPLAESTVKARARSKVKKRGKKKNLRSEIAAYKKSMKILQITGRLRKSWTAVAKPDEIEFGSNVAYAKYPQTGTEDSPERAMAPMFYRNGKWEFGTKGKALEFKKRFEKSVMEFIRTGKVT